MQFIGDLILCLISTVLITQLRKFRLLATSLYLGCELQEADQRDVFACVPSNISLEREVSLSAFLPFCLVHQGLRVGDAQAVLPSLEATLGVKRWVAPGPFKTASSEYSQPTPKTNGGVPQEMYTDTMNTQTMDT